MAPPDEVLRGRVPLMVQTSSCRRRFECENCLNDRPWACQLGHRPRSSGAGQPARRACPRKIPVCSPGRVIGAGTEFERRPQACGRWTCTQELFRSHRRARDQKSRALRCLRLIGEYLCQPVRLGSRSCCRPGTSCVRHPGSLHAPRSIGSARNPSRSRQDLTCCSKFALRLVCRT